MADEKITDQVNFFGFCEESDVDDVAAFVDGPRLRRRRWNVERHDDVGSFLEKNGSAPSDHDLGSRGLIVAEIMFPSFSHVCEGGSKFVVGGCVLDGNHTWRKAEATNLVPTSS